MRFAAIVVLLSLVACSGEVRVVDISDIRGPAVAFIVDFADGEVTQLGSALLIDKDGFLVDAKQTYDATGFSSHVVALQQDSLQKEAGFYQSSLRFNELYDARLAALDEDRRPFQNDSGAWLPLKFPEDTVARPADSGISFSEILQVELPIERNFSCAVSGTLRDFEGEFSGLGRTPHFVDFHVVSNERVIALAPNYILDLRVDEPLSAIAPGTRLHQAGPRMGFGQIAVNPRNPSQLWVAQRSDRDGVLREFVLGNDGLQPTATEYMRTTRLRAVGVMQDGIPVASGSPGTDEDDTHIHVFDGQPDAPQMFGIPERPHRIQRSIRNNAISVGLEGNLVRYEDGRWTSKRLIDRNGVVFTPRGFAERLVDGEIETWIVGDDGNVSKQTGNAEIERFFVPLPPGFRCQEGGEFVASNFIDIVIFEGRFGIIAPELCSDLLVVDLDNPDCTSTIQYDGPPVSPRVNALQLHGNRVWQSAHEANLLYADLEAP